MRVLVDVHRRRRAAHPLPQREGRQGLLPRAARPGRAAAATCCSTARSSRSSTASRRSARWPTGCTSATPGARPLLAESNPVTLLVFDLLRLDGEDLTGRPLSERRRAAGGSRPARRALAGAGDLRRRRRCCWRRPRQQRLEGIVSKKRSVAATTPGRRSPDWLKFPHRDIGSYVVGGWRHETDSASRIGAVLVGEPTADGLVYRGRVGSGIAGKEGQRLLERARAAARRRESRSPTRCRRSTRAGTVWVRPEVVVDVAALGLTPAKRLRQPAYRGVRTDLDPGGPGGRRWLRSRPTRCWSTSTAGR